jgi:signal transduction histidine kinase
MRLFGRQIKGVNRNITHHQRRKAVPAPHLSRVGQLHELSTRFLSGLDFDSIVGGLFDAASSVAAVNAVTFRLRNQSTGEFDPIACHNLDQDEWRKTTLGGTVGLSKMVIENKKPLTLVDLQSYAGTQIAPFLKLHGLVSYLGIPLLIRNRVIGVVGLYSRNAHGFDEADVTYLVLLGDLVAFALANTGHLARAVEDTEKPRASHSLSGSTVQAKEEFLNVMSHEFRTPLSLIMGHAGLMREGLLGEINEEQQNSLERILENSNNLLAMVLSILQTSRIEVGSVRLLARKIVLHELFDELKAIYGPQENDRRRIVWYCSPDLELLRSDPERLREILRYLIDNAVKFTAYGRIVIAAERCHKPAGIRFTVADTGIGIPTAALAFIFDRFRQADSSAIREFDGAGLGLYIAKKYADLLGGELSVISEVGYGSTFTLKLPSGA